MVLYALQERARGENAGGVGGLRVVKLPQLPQDATQTGCMGWKYTDSRE